MPTVDVENGLAPGFGPPDEQVYAFFRRYLPDFYFVNTPISRMRRHLALIENLAKEPLQFDFHRPAGARFTELTLCAYDEIEPGLLSKVAGALVALKINVHTAWIHTLDNPLVPQNDKRVVLDTLILSETYFHRMRPLTQKTQKNIAQMLSDVLSEQVDVDYLLERGAWRGQTPLHVLDLSGVEAGSYTLVKLRAEDDAGLLYRATRALSALHLDVRHAQINTFDRAADDVFFLTDQHGEPLPAEKIPEIVERFKSELGATY